MSLFDPNFFKIVLAAALFVSSSACVQQHDGDDLVRHHLGYIKVITPAGQSQSERQGAVTTSNIKTLGLWVDVDRRQDVSALGSGLGFGYRDDQRNIIPKNCHVIFQLESAEHIRQAIELLEQSTIGVDNICMYQDY